MIRFWYAVHNAVAHPLMAFYQPRWAVRFHDWTARKMGTRDVHLALVPYLTGRWDGSSASVRRAFEQSLPLGADPERCAEELLDYYSRASDNQSVVESRRT